MILQHQRRLSRSSRTEPGFASILIVLSAGIALMIMLLVMYNDTSNSQHEQSNNLLAHDYKQREDAVLRALTDIIPNKAILCMQDGSKNNVNLEWSKVFDDALTQANASISIDDATLKTLGVDASQARSANTADTSKFDVNTVATSVNGEANQIVSEGVTRSFTAPSSEYPPALKLNLAPKEQDTSKYPIISYVKGYDTSVWVDAFSDDFQFGVLPVPSTFFNYGNDGKIIAKQNWWAFNLNFSRKLKNGNLDSDYYTERKLRQTADSQYIISIYEIPSQLAINAGSLLKVGGANWTSNVEVEGSIFAEKIKKTGSFSIDGMASRKGVILTDGSSVMGSSERETAINLGTAYPITSSSDAGIMSFIPINRGLDFYDRFSVNDGKTAFFGLDSNGGAQNQFKRANGNGGKKTISPTNWDYYSIGANQCRMNLVITEVVSLDDQTPTEIEFTYLEGDSFTMRTFTKDASKVNESSQIYAWDFSTPFKTGSTFEGRPCIEVSLAKLQEYLTTIGADSPEFNHSISINPDYINNTDIKKPFRDGLIEVAVGDYKDDLCLRIVQSDDLTQFTKGFSLVTNLRLIFAENVNMEKLTSGPLSGEYPPLSSFSPEKVFGDASYSAPVTIEGQMGSVSKKSDTNGQDVALDITDIKSGSANTPNSANKITLRGITNPSLLPPINMMNWMVVIKEKH